MFIQDFRLNQIKHLRPGIAKLVANILKQIYIEFRNGSLSTGTFLNLLVNRLSQNLLVRKQRMRTSVLAKIGLFHPYTFSSIPIPDADDMYHNYKFLKDHLFYLMNPSLKDDWALLTFKPKEGSTALQYFNESTNSVSDWDMQLTYFESKELLTFLASVAVPLEKSVTAILRNARQESLLKHRAIADEPNSNARSLPGNPLEVSSSSSIVDATNHCPRLYENSPDHKQSQEFSVKGSTGSDFLACLFENLFRKLSFEKRFGVEIEYSRSEIFHLENFLKGFRFPCLYSIDRKIEIIEKLSSIESSEVYMKSFSRGANSNEVDGFFEIKEISTRRSHYVCCECKNRNERIGSETLTPILQKFNRFGGMKIGLIFCLEAVFSSPESSSFSSYFRQNRINVYRSRLTRSGNDDLCSKIEVFPFDSRSGSGLVSDPNQVIFIFESLLMDRR